MRTALTALILCLCASLLLNMSGTGTADAMSAPGPDDKNFIYYVDISGSMSLGYLEKQSSKIGGAVKAFCRIFAPQRQPKQQLSKINLAIKLLHRLNEEMPDIKANVGVYTFGPHREYRRVIPYDRDSLTEAFNQIPTDFKFAGRPTPMGSGIQNLDTTIAALPGSVSFIVITDGESNIGDPPAEVIQDVYDRYGDRVCFHFISFAENPSEKTFVANLSTINQCSVLVEAIDQFNEIVRADFIEKVFKQ